MAADVIRAIQVARIRAVVHHPARARAYAETRLIEADRRSGPGETQGDIRQTGDVIVRVYIDLAGVVDLALDTLRRLSPVLSGAVGAGSPGDPLVPPPDLGAAADPAHTGCRRWRQRP